MSDRVTFASPYGDVSLARYPARDRELLLPFDGADRYLLEELHGRAPDAERILVVGDPHGALTTALAADHAVDLVTDSHLSVLATEHNLERNERTAVIRPTALADAYDAVLIRIPKSTGRLRTDLARIAASVGTDTLVLSAAMVKHLTPAATAALHDHLGDTSATLARHKARVLVTTRDPARETGPPPASALGLPGSDHTLQTAAGTFSPGRLDLGTRALLGSLPTGLGTARVADLGCGNGILAIASALANPDARYLLIDESYDAVACAQANWDAVLPERAATITADDGLLGVPPGSLDLVLCNPPFHAGHAVEPWVAQRLLDQAARALRPGGRLLVVGNRHLDHHGHLRRHFRRVQRLADTAKFTVTQASR